MHNILKFYTGYSDDSAVVQWQYGEYSSYFTIEEARQKAIALFECAAIAEIEQGLMEFIDQDSPIIIRPTNGEKAALALRLARPPIYIGLAPIIGYKSRKGLVECKWFGDLIQFDPDGAREQAKIMLECAECAETDYFINSVFTNEYDATPDEVQSIMKMFLKFREDHRGTSN